MERMPRAEAFAALTACHLAAWYRANRYCGCCGRARVPSTTERALVCPNCGDIVYPRINPAVIVAVTNGERILLTRYAPAHGPTEFYALVAGFCEIGETAEDTVRREVLEEVGLRVRNIRYYASQPWGIDGNLSLGIFRRAGRQRRHHPGAGRAVPSSLGATGGHAPPLHPKRPDLGHDGGFPHRADVTGIRRCMPRFPTGKNRPEGPRRALPGGFSF